ncbi:MAG: serine/threonine-protein kinase [Deltaproteobacteria bacterium]|nr:serine/threonine-protein kinase [Deltaproteobacteria bacterium]
MAVKPPVIGGKYTLLRRLGHGGMAEVFLAKQSGDGGFEKLVVLKRILPHLSQSGEFAAMFLDEARVAADLRHPNVVNIVDVGRIAAASSAGTDTLYMVMEFLHGQDVRKLQRKVAAYGQMIPLGHACQVAVDAAAGLHYAHTKKDLNGKQLQIVHRDVSPQNILVTFEGGTKIVDFGIAKAAGQSTHTSTGVLKGKYTYMSPEQAEGQAVDARTDQFALGIVLWELLTMRRLFKRDTEVLTLEAITEGPIPRPRRFREDCPLSIEDVVMTALARDKNKRFRDCEEMALALEDALAKESIVHSGSRLSQYMRRLFADQLAEEASLGVVQPDGSLSAAKNTFPMNEKKKEAAAEKEPEKAAVDEKPDPPQPDATTADRKRGRTRSDGGRAETDTAARAAKDKEKEKEKEKEKPAASRPTKPPAADPRSVPPEKPRDRGDDRGRDRAIADRGPRSREPAVNRKTAIAALAAAAGGAVVVAAIFLIASAVGDGPATLIVRSEPKGAHVFLDDVDTKQETPALLKGVTSGEPHKVRLELEGHRSLSEVVTIARKGETHEVKLELKKGKP